LGAWLDFRTFWALRRPCAGNAASRTTKKTSVSDSEYSAHEAHPRRAFCCLLDSGHHREHLLTGGALMVKLARLFALFVVVALVILGALVRDIRTAQSEHFATGQSERQTLILQNDEIIELLREGK
jgi:hypothetical protein